MIHVFRYLRSVFEVGIGAFFGIALVGASIKAIVGIGLLIPYWSIYNFAITTGDALAAFIVFLLARWLIRDGCRVWSLARATTA